MGITLKLQAKFLSLQNYDVRLTEGCFEKMKQ